MLSFAAQIDGSHPSGKTVMGRSMETTQSRCGGTDGCLWRACVYRRDPVLGLRPFDRDAVGAGVCAEVSLARVLFRAGGGLPARGVFGGAVEKNMEYARHGCGARTGRTARRQGRGAISVCSTPDCRRPSDRLPAERAEALVENCARAARGFVPHRRVTEASNERPAGTLWVRDERLENLLGGGRGGPASAAV